MTKCGDFQRFSGLTRKVGLKIEKNGVMSLMDDPYLGAAMCIISTAQHARPKVKGHNEHFRPQFTRSSILAMAQSTLSFFPSICQFWKLTGAKNSNYYGNHHMSGYNSSKVFWSICIPIMAMIQRMRKIKKEKNFCKYFSISKNDC